MTTESLSIVLPFAPEEFLTTSVEGAQGGNWEQRFRRIRDATPADARYFSTYRSLMPLMPTAMTACWPSHLRMAPCNSLPSGMVQAATDQAALAIS